MEVEKLLDPRVIRVSRNEILLLFSDLEVKEMLGCMLLM